MNNLKNLVLLISFLAFSISCGKEDINQDGLIDKMESTIMNECFENSLTSKTDIENNLIGKWNLIGYGQTLFQDNPQPNITLNLNDSIIVFENQTANIVDTLQWEIEEISTGNKQSFLLKTEGNYIELGIQVFCKNYMYLQTLALNSTIGYTYIYEKIE